MNKFINRRIYELEMVAYAYRKEREFGKAKEAEDIAYGYKGRLVLGEKLWKVFDKSDDSMHTLNWAYNTLKVSEWKTLRKALRKAMAGSKVAVLKFTGT